MGKRFTDTEKWKDKWFRKLKPIYKVCWDFLTENCDVAGFWKKDYELMEFMVGEKIEESELLEALNEGKERVRNCGDYLNIVDFVDFQYGQLSPTCNPHKPILKLIDFYKKKGLIKGFSTLMEKEQEQEKDKEKEKDLNIKFKLEDFEEVWELYPGTWSVVDRNHCLRLYEQQTPNNGFKATFVKAVTGYKHLLTEQTWRQIMNPKRFFGGEWNNEEYINFIPEWLKKEMEAKGAGSNSEG